LEDLSWVPEDLRNGYHVLKNAHVLPPEVELLKDIHTLEDLIKHVEDEGERRALAKSIQWKMIRLDMLKRRSLDLSSVRNYSRKMVAKFTRGCSCQPANLRFCPLCLKPIFRGRKSVALAAMQPRQF